MSAKPHANGHLVSEYGASMESVSTYTSTRHLFGSCSDSRRFYSIVNHGHSMESCVVHQDPRNGHYSSHYCKHSRRVSNSINEPSSSYASTFSDESCHPKHHRHKPSLVITQWCHAFKNLLVLSLSFMLLFTAFISMQTLQSSLHPHSNIGIISLGCYYGATALSCFLSPSIIARLGTKWTIFTAFVFYLVHIAANFYPTVYLVIPSAVLVGALTGPLWSGQATYLTTLAICYADSTGQLLEAVISSFNGIFYGFLQTSQVWGNLISATLLGADNTTVYLNTMNVSLLKHACGAKDCGLWDEFPTNAFSHQLKPVPPSTHHILLSIYLLLVLLAMVLTAVLLSSLPVSAPSSPQLFLRMFCDPRLQLLCPIVVFTGLQQGFLLGDFTKSYINCALGIHKIGLVMMCFGAVNALCSVLIGHVAKHIKRYPIMVSGTLFHCGLLIALIWWQPSPEDLPMFYVMAFCLGLCDAIWQTQTNALFGVLFQNDPEAAFSCYRLLQCLGSSFAFAFGAVFCVCTKVYIMGCFLGVGVVMYSVVEIQQHKSTNLRQNVAVL